MIYAFDPDGNLDTCEVVKEFFKTYIGFKENEIIFLDVKKTGIEPRNDDDSDVTMAARIYASISIETKVQLTAAADAIYADAKNGLAR